MKKFIQNVYGAQISALLVEMVIFFVVFFITRDIKLSVVIAVIATAIVAMIVAIVFDSDLAAFTAFTVALVPFTAFTVAIVAKTVYKGDSKYKELDAETKFCFFIGKSFILLIIPAISLYLISSVWAGV